MVSGLPEFIVNVLWLLHISSAKLIQVPCHKEIKQTSNWETAALKEMCK